MQLFYVMANIFQTCGFIIRVFLSLPMRFFTALSLVYNNHKEVPGSEHVSHNVGEL
jgi:hypothetical protein